MRKVKKHGKLRVLRKLYTICTRQAPCDTMMMDKKLTNS